MTDKKINTIYTIFIVFLIFLSIDTKSQWTQLGSDLNGEAVEDELGWSVSLSADGKTMACGAIDNDGSGNNAGHVRVYSLLDSTWVQIGQDIDGEEAEDGSGRSVSLSDDGSIVCIGAWGNGPGSGHVRVYEYDEDTWVQKGADIDGEANGDGSGVSVSCSSDGLTVSIGAYYNNGNGTFQSGHVRVYEFVGIQWVQKGDDIDGEDSFDAFGFSVSMNSDGSIVAVGAMWNNGTAGHVRVYEFVGNQWVQKGEDIDGEADNDHSGNAVSLSSNGLTVAIGARRNDGNGEDAGHVRIFSYDGENWLQLGEDIDGEAAGDHFGGSVSLSSNGLTLAAGAINNDGTGSNAGHARVYSLINNTWTQIGEDIEGSSSEDFFGWSVSLNAEGDTLAIGAVQNDANGEDAGQVKVYSFNSNTNILEFNKDLPVKIYPNPASNYVDVQLQAIDKPTDISVVNSMGQEVINIPNITKPNISISLIELSSGVYYINVISDERNITSKLLKN